ncbi:hypothetical protein [Formosa sp. PL04]|uniref:hypothetical protein n=1 Tax=Formosa sp. PL04 TaxID=3081755 RepID=UPI002981E074|nr:hypothetical protein [Formosa sp. PL04]MDW5290588.1 hypothetical protein [Formosa sp. PL04]
MHKNVDYIIQLFPDFEEQIDFLFQTDENFRDMCSDYMLCKSMIQELKNKKIIHSEDFTEMEALQQSLKEEIEVQLIIKK